jgi:hypothetical protein
MDDADKRSAAVERPVKELKDVASPNPGRSTRWVESEGPSAAVVVWQDLRPSRQASLEAVACSDVADRHRCPGGVAGSPRPGRLRRRGVSCRRTGDRHGRRMRSASGGDTRLPRRAHRVDLPCLLECRRTVPRRVSRGLHYTQPRLNRGCPCPGRQGYTKFSGVDPVTFGFAFLIVAAWVGLTDWVNRKAPPWFRSWWNRPADGG